MNQRLVLRALLIFAVGGILLAAAAAWLYLTGDNSSEVATSDPKQETFAEPGSVPIGGPFTLTDYTGKTVTDKDFRGKYLLVFFGFTRCPDVCPTTLNEIAVTLDRLGGEASAVLPLFISVDPERDTPSSMAEYVKALHPRIVGLTGSKEQIAAVTKEFRVYYEKISAAQYYGTDSNGGTKEGAEKSLEDDYLISHQGNTYLMSPKGEYLTHFAYGTKPEEMAETIRKAIERFGTPGN